MLTTVFHLFSMISCSRKLRRLRGIDFGPLHIEFDLLNSFQFISTLHQIRFDSCGASTLFLCSFLHLLYMLTYYLPSYLIGAAGVSTLWRGAFLTCIYISSFFLL